MVSIHIMCGMPGSGKTTLSKQLALEHDAILYCYDTFQNTNYINSYEAMYSVISETLMTGKSVVYDDLNIVVSIRSTILKALSNVHCRKVLHVMLTPLEECLKRCRNRSRYYVPSSAIEYYMKRYEEPTLSEGWDEIIYHDIK